MISEASQIEDLAKSVDDNGGAYFAPAFSGLFACTGGPTPGVPWWV